MARKDIAKHRFALVALCALSLIASSTCRHRVSSPPGTTQAFPGSSCIRAHGNRLYRQRDGSFAYLNADRMARSLLERPPPHSQRTADGLYRDGNELYVDIRIGEGVGTARVAVDGDGYRVRLDNDVPGPFIARRPDGHWQLANDENNLAKGSFLADIVPETTTENPGVLRYAARLMEWVGIAEARIAAIPSLPEHAMAPAIAEIAPALLLTVDHAFNQTLSARLRRPAATTWSPSEIRSIASDIATFIGRPLAFYRPDRTTLSSLAMPDGRSSPSGRMPDDTLKLAYDGDRVTLMERRGRESHEEYPTIFQAVEAARRDPFDFRARLPADAEHAFRTDLANFIDARSNRARHERMYRKTASATQMPPLQTKKLMKVLLLRRALFDIHHPLTVGEESRLLRAVHRLMPEGRAAAIEVRDRDTGERLALADSETPSGGPPIVILARRDSQGDRVNYYREGAPGHSPIPSRHVIDAPFSPIVDPLLNANHGGGALRDVLGLGEWDFQPFAEKILARIADDENVALHAPFDELAVSDADILTRAHEDTDEWSSDGRHFVRLRNLDGQTRLVETSPVAIDAKFEILRPVAAEGGNRGTGYFLRSNDGLWYPAGASAAPGTGRTEPAR
ncbi:hypothetical protein [Luteibacter yeojuensis]|uniref:Uncharacterized protein n=1 Tax=Luteibacter yeojuensis TaxID=345309 RepID=A0A7X5TRL2_9GAMM|nr:hypothetical protein [Luteibacter yeojuensis]NID16999.1 hypothetical protein [Luteibacter yeojuensis]